MKVDPSVGAGQSSSVYCLYCGRQSVIKDFFPLETWRRLQDAAKAMAEQYVAQAFSEMLGYAVRGSRHMSFTPGRPPAIRRLSTYTPELTRRTTTCGSCSESYAVFGIALYCVKCGALPPAERFTEVLQVQRRLLSHFDDLPAELRVQMEADGAFTRIYEDTVKDTFGALESFLDGVFRSRVAGAACLLRSRATSPAIGACQRALRGPLQVPLDVLDVPAWATLLDGTALRHVLTTPTVSSTPSTCWRSRPAPIKWDNACMSHGRTR